MAAMKRMIGSAVMAGLMAATVSCSSSECYENHSAMPLADFYSMETFGKVSVSGLEIYGVGAPGDSVLYSSQTLSQAYLPFRLWSDTTTYVFAYKGAFGGGENNEMDDSFVPRDTVRFVYKRQPWFVNPACGAMYYFDMDTVKYTTLLIDSIYVEPRITNENAANIKIFFKNG